MNDQDQLNEPDNNGAYAHVTAVSMTEFMQYDILPGSLQQPQKAFEDFWGHQFFPRSFFPIEKTGSIDWTQIKWR